MKVMISYKKKRAPVLKLGGPSCREMRGANLFEVLHVNPALPYYFPAPALSLLFPPEVSFLLRPLKSR